MPETTRIPWSVASQRLIIRTKMGALGASQTELERQLAGDRRWQELTERYPELAITPVFMAGDGSGLSSEAQTYYEVLLPSDWAEATELANAATEILVDIDSIESVFFVSLSPQPEEDLGIEDAGGRTPQLFLMESVNDQKDASLAEFRGPSQDNPLISPNRWQEGAAHTESTRAVIEKLLRGKIQGVFVTSMCITKGQQNQFWRDCTSTQICELLKLLNSSIHPGDILLIEQQIWGWFEGKAGNAPIELDPSNQAALAAAAEKGIIVIEPAGNGFPNGNDKPYVGIDLAEIGLETGNGNITGQYAICVGACNEGATERLADSNYGAAVACFCAVTEGQDYGGTSAAAAQLACLAWWVQWKAMSAPDDPGPLSLNEMRTALVLYDTTDPAHGVMLNVGNIIAEHFPTP